MGSDWTVEGASLARRALLSSKQRDPQFLSPSVVVFPLDPPVKVGGGQKIENKNDLCGSSFGEQAFLVAACIISRKGNDK